MSFVQGLLSLQSEFDWQPHALGPPIQLPPEHVSGLVHTLPSLHVVPSGAAGFEQMPVTALHVPARWQASLAAHTFAFDPVQTPPWHVSVSVHAFPSLQAIVLLVW